MSSFHSKGFEAGILKDFSQEIIVHLAKTIPQRFVAKSGPSNRRGKIFIDYLRNGLGATTVVCAWSVRARLDLGVSVPLTWEELAGLASADHWTAANIHDDRINEMSRGPTTKRQGNQYRRQ